VKIKKQTALVFWVGAIILVSIACSQTWFTLAMAPNGETVELKSFDGFTTYAFISPFLVLSGAAAFTFLFLPGVARLVIGSIASLFTAALLALVTLGVAKSDISALSSEIEAATGIATAHGLKQIETTVSSSASLAIVAIALLLIIQVGVTFASKSWPARVARTELPRTVTSDENDTISIWDSQR
jgi:TM2 domain-containing membrane protein YozV